MNTDEIWAEVLPVVSEYASLIRQEVHERWQAWPLDLSKREMHEVIGALLARQGTLANHLAYAPGTWNAHVGPLILRAMVDNIINLAWILEDPLERSRQFILHGLGLEKLLLEHFKAKLTKEGVDPNNEPDVKQWEDWLNTKRYVFLTEVNVGSWSGISTRKMAEEAGYLDLYNRDYAQWSGSTHNMWHHVMRHNLGDCPNPLHRLHSVPVVPGGQPDLDVLLQAADYATAAFEVFDRKMGIQVEVPSARDYLFDTLDRLGNEWCASTVGPSTGDGDKNRA